MLLHAPHWSIGYAASCLLARHCASRASSIIALLIGSRNNLSASAFRPSARRLHPYSVLRRTVTYSATLTTASRLLLARVLYRRHRRCVGDRAFSCLLLFALAVPEAVIERLIVARANEKVSGILVPGTWHCCTWY